MDKGAREIWFAAGGLRGYRTVHWKGWLLSAAHIGACLGIVALAPNGGWALAGLATVTVIGYVIFRHHADFF